MSPTATGYDVTDAENCMKYFPNIGCWFDIIVEDEEVK